MLFTDRSFFVLVFATMALFYVPLLRRWQTAVLVAASVTFYGLNCIGARQTGCVLLPVAAFAINGSASYLICSCADERRAKRWTIAGIVAHLVTVACVYQFGGTGFVSWPLPEGPFGEDEPGHFLRGIALPVGIAFFAFEGIGLVIDAYRGRSRPVRHEARADDVPRLGRIALFVGFFPRLVAGPILKARDFYPQSKPKLLRDVRWAFCFRRLVLGYFLVTVVGDGLRSYTVWMRFPEFHQLPGSTLALLLAGYSMQVFAEFAGYSLIAVGLAGLFGYHLPADYDFPYVSQSFGEFWRRWHVSLTNWLAESLHLLLGSEPGHAHNRASGGSRACACITLVAAMAVGGLWHGVTWGFAAWGALHGMALAVERVLARGRGSLSTSAPASARAYVGAIRALSVFTLVTFAWLPFKFSRLSDAGLYVVDIVRNWSFGPPGGQLVCDVLLYSSPVVFYHLAYLARAPCDLQGKRGHFILIPVWQRMPAEVRDEVSGWAIAIVYGWMLFLIFLQQVAPDESLGFPF